MVVTSTSFARPLPASAQQRTPGCDDRCQLVRYVDPSDLEVVLCTLHDPAAHEEYGTLLGDTRWPRWLSWRDIEVDPTCGEVWRDGGRAHLTPVELAILRALAVDIGQVVPHGAILARAYGWSLVDESCRHLLRMYVLRLRRKLGAGLIETFPGVGYRLVAPASMDEEAHDG